MSLLLKHRYQVLEILSEAGGFGQTFLAEDTDTPSRRRCVIKKLRPITDEDRKKFKDENALLEHIKFVQERFHREAAILERLGDNCDQIPKLYAYFVENQEFYLVQELIDGLTLRQKLQREGVLDENTVRNLLWSLLNVLEYVHSQNIIHRDIKPDNIILRQRDNKPVLIDFGIVKEVLRVDVDGNPTSSALAGGTPGYTASEQAAGRPAYASDIYSLGATAIYLLTGKNPQQMTDLKTGDIAWRQFAPQVGASFAAVLHKATESHTRDRYETATKMREDLQRVFRGEPTIYAQPLPATTEEETIVRPVAIPQPLLQQPKKPNYALYLGGAAIVGLLVIVGAIVLLFNLNNPNREMVQATNTQNVNISRNTNPITNQNTNLSNANSTISDSNTQVNSNIDATNANIGNANLNTNVNVAPTPDKAQLQQSINSYIADSLKADRAVEGAKSARKSMSADIDGDGDTDTIVQYIAVPREGNYYGIKIALFKNNNGKFEGVADADVGGQNFRSFELTSIKGNKITGRISLCNREFPRTCLDKETPYTKGTTVITWTGNKLLVPENDSLDKPW